MRCLVWDFCILPEGIAEYRPWQFLTIQPREKALAASQAFACVWGSRKGIVKSKVPEDK